MAPSYPLCNTPLRLSPLIKRRYNSVTSILLGSQSAAIQLLPRCFESGSRAAWHKPDLALLWDAFGA